MDNNTPTVVKIHDVNIDKDYINWIEELKSRYRSAQIKAAVKVNAEKLHFNWELGRDLVIRKAEERWGTGVVEQVSLDLQAAFPESKGFSASNLWRMKQWYQFYCNEAGKLAQVARELQAHDYQNVRKLAQAARENLHGNNIQKEGTDFPEILACVPWGHHIEIIAKCKNIYESIFYILKTISGGWSRNTLTNCIKADYYHTSGGAISNFADRLPSPQSELAQAITKDTYDFGFLTLEEGYKEEALETDVQYAFQGIQTPMGVASYTNVQIKEIQDQLPSVEELTKRIRLLEEQLSKKK